MNSNRPANPVWVNVLRKCPRANPADYLTHHRPLHSGVDPNVKGLRSNALRRERELVEASLFCYGLSFITGQSIWVIDHEDSDYDFVLLREVGEDNHYSRTQLKELVSRQGNPNTSLQSIIDKLAEYPRSEDLTVAIRFNQTAMLDLDEIVVGPQLRLGAIWIYGSETPDGSRWLVRGNLMERDKPNLGWSFDYPVSGYRDSCGP